MALTAKQKEKVALVEANFNALCATFTEDDLTTAKADKVIVLTGKLSNLKRQTKAGNHKLRLITQQAVYDVFTKSDPGDMTTVEVTNQTFSIQTIEEGVDEDGNPKVKTLLWM